MKSTHRRPDLPLVLLAALGAGSVAGAEAAVRTAPSPAAQEPAPRDGDSAKPLPARGTESADSQQASKKKEADRDPAAKGEEPAKETQKGSWTPPKVSGVDLGSIEVELPAPEPKAHPSNANQVNPPFEKREVANVRLVVEEGADTYDFGKLSQGESPSHKFVLQVEGEEDLVIKRIKASCGCTLAKSEVVTPTGERQAWTQDAPIPPGSTLEVDATLNTESKRGQVSTNVAIYSNDDRFAVRRLTLRANVQALVDVEPTSYNFGQISPFDEAEGLITLTGNVDTPFAVELADERVLRDELEVELVPIDPDAEGRSTKWEARLSLGPGLDEGIKNYPLHFKTDLQIQQKAAAAAGGGEEGAAPAAEYRAYAMAQVQGLIFTTPNYSAFGMMRPGERQSRTFRIQTRDPEFEFPESPAIEVKGFKGEFELPDNIEVTAERAPDKKSLAVEVSVFDLPEDFQGSFSGFVEVEIGHPTKETVRSRFSGIARPGVSQPAGAAGN